MRGAHGPTLHYRSVLHHSTATTVWYLECSLAVCGTAGPTDRSSSSFSVGLDLPLGIRTGLCRSPAQQRPFARLERVVRAQQWDVMELLWELAAARSS